MGPRITINKSDTGETQSEGVLLMHAVVVCH